MNKKIRLIVIALLLIAGISFYWYEIRPSQIRKKCVSIVNNKKEFSAEKYLTEREGKTYFDENGYKKCLLENGINK